MMRPGDYIDLVMPTSVRPILDVAASLGRFGTVAFGFEMMRDLISMEWDVSPGSWCPFDEQGRLTQAGGMRIQLGAWLGIVPEAYRTAVTAIVLERFERWRGERANSDTLHAFVRDLNETIGATLEPRDP